MKFPWYEYAANIATIVIGVAGSLFLIKRDWKRYGLLFLLSGAVGTGLCYAFVLTGLYIFPNRPIQMIWSPPFLVMVTFVPFTVLAGVQFSPQRWIWKIPYYWAIVHIAVVSEVVLLAYTGIFRFTFGWDLWDSYTAWWLFYLIFEWIGGKIIPPRLRTPLSGRQFRYGRWAWIVFHTIVISTIFAFGVFVGFTMKQ
ncbi:hypothetical protein J2T17_002243 [Paenibacillus mucilaginosus]|uniref:CBO0543 family protein n=1 Tax=Paenibacillus mucilaginosus TaxID=61624 RepID=UPI003D213FE3